MLPLLEELLSMWRCLPIVLLAAVAAGCGAGADDRSLAIGSSAPDFALPGIDGKVHSLGEYASSRVLAVVFTCNHCPAAQRYEDRLRELDEDYRGKSMTLVAINADNPDAVPLSELTYSDGGDSLVDMKARASYRRLQYPYLYDGESQSASAKFGVDTLPHIFVFDEQRKLRYKGRIDDNVNEAQVKTRDARGAIDALLAGSRVTVERTAVTGCQRAILANPSQRQQEMSKIEAEPVTLQMAAEDELKKLRANPTGKLLLVNFWATWCGPCVTEFPELQATYRMYRNRGFDFVSVSSNEPDDEAQVVEFLQKNHASGRNLQFATPDTFGLQAAFDPAMPAAVPFTVLIAPNGDVLFQQLGELDFLKLRRTILANLPDDDKHPGQQAYWSAH
jgi:thiol-disulfide isomerase/thioredoxin